MRFALLGIDKPTLALAHAIRGSEQHELTHVFSDLADASRLGIAVRSTDEWEVLLAGGDHDAVLVAASRELSALGKPEAGEQFRLEQIRRLAQAGIPLLVSHPITFSVLDGYEIEMAAADQRTVVMPILPLRETMADLLRECRSLGEVTHVSLERNLGPLPLGEALALFAHDVDLLSEICGGISKISAMGTWSERGAEPQPLGDVSVLRGLGAQLASSSGCHCQWSPQSPAAEKYLKLMVGGPAGQLRLLCDEHGQYELARGNEQLPGPASTLVAAEMLLARFVAAVHEENIDAANPSSSTAHWTDAIRSLELTEGLLRSLRRDRTIEIRADASSEVGAFKSTMASVGCFLLIGGLVLMVLAAIVAGVAHRFGFARLAEIAGGSWYWILIATMGGFLVLQLLRFVIPDERKNSADSSDFAD